MTEVEDRFSKYLLLHICYFEIRAVSPDEFIFRSDPELLYELSIAGVLVAIRGIWLKNIAVQAAFETALRFLFMTRSYV